MQTRFCAFLASDRQLIGHIKLALGLPVTAGAGWFNRIPKVLERGLFCGSHQITSAQSKLRSSGDNSADNHVSSGVDNA